LCTLALARWLGVPVPAALTGRVERMVAAGRYERRVFLVRPLGFVMPTAARRITYPDALRFEVVHVEVYTEYGYELVDVPPGPVADRVALVRGVIGG
jgi:predicted ATPase